MARLLTSGFEIYSADLAGSVATSTDGPDGDNEATGIVLDTSVFRSGLSSLKADFTGGFASKRVIFPFVCSPDTDYFPRVFLRFTSVPTNVSGLNILSMESASASLILAKLENTGQVGLYSGATLIGLSSAVLSPDIWYMIELRLRDSSVAASDEIELRVEGESVAISTTLTFSSVPVLVGVGAAGFYTGSIYLDDFAFNDSNGTDQNSWPGNGHVVLMKPGSDSQRGSWTGGAGGTTNLFDAVNNTPPIGTATETNLTQIESADSSGGNATDEYRGDCGTYLAAGIKPWDKITTIQSWVCHGEDVATGTKTGSHGFQANPAVAYSTWTFGDDVGLLGTYPANWRWNASTIDNPTVDNTAALILAVRKTDSGTRVASVCFLGAYVEYVPLPPPHNHILYRYN